MRYKVGDEVYLPDDTFYEMHKDIPLEIKEVDKAREVYYTGEMIYLTDDDIDHEKTAELNMENYAKYMEEQINDPSYQELLKELSKPVVDTVNRPPHYTQGDIETIDIIKILTQGYTGYEGSLVSNVIKYLARANFKGNKVKDIQKSQFYLNKLVEELE